MDKLHKNIQPIEFEKFVSQVNKKVYKVKGYYSIYITPDGQIVDCRYPQDLGHNLFSTYVYEHLNELPNEIYPSSLRTFNIPFKEIPYYLMDYFNLLDVMYVDIGLYNKINSHLLASEDRICQDLGFVKVSINNHLKIFELSIPNVIFEKNVTGAQKDILKKLSEFFDVDLLNKLKQEQRINTEIATEIKSALKSLEKKY